MADPIPNTRFVPTPASKTAGHRIGERVGLALGYGCMAIGFGLALVLALAIATASLRWAFG